MKPAHSTPLRIGDWRVDPEVDEISGKGGVVKLEPRAMRLLMFLAERAGQVVSVEDLLSDVWSGVIVTSDSVYQAVAALRRTLGDDSKSPQYIATLPRRGYRLVASVAPWTEAAAVASVAPTGKAPWYRLAPIVGLALIAGYLVIDRTVRVRQIAPAVSAKAAASVPISGNSIAVLPFVDMSEKKDQEYFADGVAEEILDLLARIPGLHVPARTSSFYFKGKSEDIPAIARRLMVANVLEGSVRKSGDHLRITVQLIKADNGYNLWSETYDRTLDDIFKVQDEIAGKVVTALKLSIGASEPPRTVPTNNPEVHVLLLQAEFLLNRETQDGLTRANDYLQRAVLLDPDSAAAWALLSEALTLAWVDGWLPAGRTFQQQREQAQRAAERAVAIDPKLGGAHEALGMVRHWFDWDWGASATEFEQVRALDPADTDAIVYAGRLAALQGRLGEALRLYDEAVAKDPLNDYAYTSLAVTYCATGQLTEALAAAQKVVDLAPAVQRSHAILAQVLLALGQQDAALAEAEKETETSYREYALARIYIVLGRRADADAALARFESTYAGDWAYEIATLRALRGERDKAFFWLDRAYDQHDAALVGAPSVNIDPDVRNLHGDPRWNAFLHKMQLPQ